MADNFKTLDLRAKIQQLRSKYAKTADTDREISSLENELYLVDKNEELEPVKTPEFEFKIVNNLGFITSFEILGAIKEVFNSKDKKPEELMNDESTDQQIIKLVKDKVEQNKQDFENNNPAVLALLNNFKELDLNNTTPNSIEINVKNALGVMATIREKALYTKPIDKNSPFYIEPPKPPMWPTEKD